MELEAYGHSKISIHALREEGDRATTSPRSNHGISIHALREEGDATVETRNRAPNYFYPRPPRGGRPDKSSLAGNRLQISIHALREEGDPGAGPQEVHGSISIHALREEGDRPSRLRRATGAYFYPRPPRGGRLSASTSGAAALNFYPRPPRGGRRDTGAMDGVWDLFLSTPSARRATTTFSKGRTRTMISIHALREEGDEAAAENAAKLKISIHALREEGDTVTDEEGQTSEVFLSTPSARRATSDCSGQKRTAKDFYPRPPRGGRPHIIQIVDMLDIISIHALREEGDQAPRGAPLWTRNFYPRPPRGGRPPMAASFSRGRQFLSTPSARRATSNSILGK